MKMLRVAVIALTAWMFASPALAQGYPTRPITLIVPWPYSPYGIVGPKGMDPKVVKILHDAFRKASEDPENQKVLAQLDQVYWYKNSKDYAKWAAETNVTERTLIARLGLLAK